MKLRLVPAILTAFSAASLIAGCQSASDNLLDSADGGAQQSAAAPVQPGRNPNANLRLKNTRNALSDFCPKIVIRSGTESYRIVAKGADKDSQNDVRYQASITKAARECQYVGQDLRIRVGARGRVITGPKGGPGTVELPIRVAVQDAGCSRHFRLTRLKTTIPRGSGSVPYEFVDDTIVIPAPKTTNVQIYVGFDETLSAKPSAKRCT